MEADGFVWVLYSFLSTFVCLKFYNKSSNENMYVSTHTYNPFQFHRPPTPPNNTSNSRWQFQL